MEDNKGLNQIIVDLLDEYPPLRDDDQRLIINVWAKQYQGDLNKQVSMKEVFSIILKDFARAESITRIRRKLQEEFPQFRGKTWNDRHAKAIEVRNQIRENTYGK